MNLLEIVSRTPVPEPWTEGEKIPWDDPAFSQRMLAEHLSQAHDAASRRSETIDAHVDWIERAVLDGRRSRILDLGCGPGLYTSRLASRGHTCVGIDFSPASIEHAIEIATSADLDCAYRLGDLRETEFSSGFDLVMLIFGEFNVFHPADARSILTRARRALTTGGRLLLEVHTVDAVQRIGTTSTTWRSAETGLFTDRPHLRLDEAFWDGSRQVATERYFIIDAETGIVSRYAQSIQSYSDAEYHAILADAGFSLDGIFPSLTGVDNGGDFYTLVAMAA